MVASFNYGFRTGTLSISQRRGIILLLPKKNKDKTSLENLRPVSLLNIDYKILTKTIAKRLEKVLPKIINSDQTGYVKGRFIGENVRLIQDVMFFTEYTKTPRIAIFLIFGSQLMDYNAFFQNLLEHYKINKPLPGLLVYQDIMPLAERLSSKFHSCP